MNTSFKRVLCALLATIAGSLSCAAQSISGIVKSEEDGRPLAGAIVNVAGTAIQTTTNDQGRFYVSNLTPGQVTVQVSYFGYGDGSASVSVVSGQIHAMEVELGGEAYDLDPLVVSGGKLGQAKALNIQRSSNGLANIVAADAFGNFPDENAAEALQRMPGVSIERDQGEGRYVVVRGIDPDLNSISLDGVTLPAPESESRKVALDVIPTEILERLEVRKTITPDMDGDAIGGSVNLKTVSPFDKGGRYASIKTQFLYNDLVDAFSPMVSVAYGDLFGDRNDMGLIVAASYQEREFGSDNIEVDGPWGEEEAEDGSEAFFAPEIEFREYEVTRERKAISLNFERQLNESSSFYLRGTHNYFSDQEFRSRTEMKLEDGELQSITDTTAVVTDIEETDRDLKNRFEEQEIFILSAGGEAVSNEWTFGYGVAVSHAEENEPNRLDIDFRSEALYDASYDFSNPFQPILTVDNSASVFDGSNFEFDEGVVENNIAEEEETTVHFDARRNLLFGDSAGFVKFGAKFRAKEKTVDNRVDIYSNDSSSTSLADVAKTDSRYPYFRGPANYLKADPALTRSFFEGSMNEFEFEDEDSLIDSAAADYVSEEDVMALYGMAESNINDWTVTGGVRYEETDFNTTGNDVIFIEVLDDEGEPDDEFDRIESLTFDKTYDNVLAMLAGRYDVSDSGILRLSWTNTIARPKFGESAYRRESNFADEEIVSGNPDLDPYEAMNFDISYEHYFDGLGNVGVAVFHKDIDSFIFEETETVVIDGDSIDLIRPLNGDSASISGVELSWQQDLGQYAPSLEGFGIYSNLTLTSSDSTTEARSGEDIPFLKQSDAIANLAFTYENESILLRLAGTYRSEYLDAIGGDSSEDEYVDSHFQIDAKAVYKINPHTSFFLEAINLNDEPFQAYYGVPTRMRQFEAYSWSSKIGFKWVY